jgi:hypothetical protein
VLHRELHKRASWHDHDYAFTMSVRAALRERGEDARPVIMAELKQMLDKKVWHAVDINKLTSAQRRAILRSSMFLKDKWLASGTFEKFKARLVAGGDQQDKALYENLSSPTAATSSVLAVAAIAAAENRTAVTMDIGGAYLNADLAPTGVEVHMRLDKIMTAMLLQIDPSYGPFVLPDGCLIVQLDKALYGCVEAASLWYVHLRDKLLAWGFIENAYDICVFNKLGADGRQITVALHVDDLLVTCQTQITIDEFSAHRAHGQSARLRGDDPGFSDTRRGEDYHGERCERHPGGMRGANHACQPGRFVPVRCERRGTQGDGSRGGVVPQLHRQDTLPGQKGAA